MYLAIIIIAAVAGLASVFLFIVGAKTDNTPIAKGSALILGACILSIIAAASMASA